MNEAQTAVFAELSYDFTDSLTVTGGARWSEFERDTFQQDLGPPVNGTIQILAQTESDLVRALKDPKTEVYLR